MRIAFLVERPTQFEAPLFRWIARWIAAHGEHHFEAWFTAADAGAAPFDAELDRKVDWGFDLLADYPHQALPASGRRSWLAERLATLDLLIVNGYTRRPYVEAALAARRLGVPAALRVDSVTWDGGAPNPRDLVRAVLFRLWVRRLFPRYLAAGSLTRDFLRSRGVAAERIGFFTYAVDEQAFRERATRAQPSRAAQRRALGIPSEAVVVLTIAKLVDREAPWDLVRALALPALRDSAVWLLVAGDGARRTEVEREAHAALPSRAIFTGYWPYARLPELYALADLFVHAPAEERWGVSVAEALACGLPVVAGSRVGSSADLLVEGANGFVYRSGDPSDLAVKMLAALALPSASVRSASAGVLARWGYEATWREIVRVAALPKPAL